MHRVRAYGEQPVCCLLVQQDDVKACACAWDQASAVIDRVRRAIAAASDSVSQRIGPIATLLGRAFGVDDWCAALLHVKRI